MAQLLYDLALYARPAQSGPRAQGVLDVHPFGGKLLIFLVLIFYSCLGGAVFQILEKEECSVVGKLGQLPLERTQGRPTQGLLRYTNVQPRDRHP